MNKKLNLNEPINICIFGARGQGKSLLATHFIVDHVKRNKDVKINISIFGTYIVNMFLIK